jgi:serine phosphatase RsbU (regulator of sigma subunit)
VEWLHSTTTVLGLFKDWTGPTVECQLFPGDILALYTDGVTESFNAAQEEFGEQRLVESVRLHREQPAQPLVASIIADIQRFSPEEQHDDITLIIAKCRAGCDP